MNCDYKQGIQNPSGINETRRHPEARAFSSGARDLAWNEIAAAPREIPPPAELRQRSG